MMSPFVTQAFSMEAHVHFPFQCVLIAEAERDQSYFLETRRQCCVPDTQQGRVDFTKEMFTLILTPFCSGYYQQYSLISTSTINWCVGLKRLWGGGVTCLKPTTHTTATTSYRRDGPSTNELFSVGQLLPVYRHFDGLGV